MNIPNRQIARSPDRQTSYLDPKVLAAIGGLELRARMIVEGLMTGMHRSPFQGFSIEFAQHRPYVPGDDLRFLDWKVFGRTDKLYLKQYQRETNLDLLLLVDVSGSMGYRSEEAAWSKYDCGASIAAAVGYLALEQQDRVGVAMFADKVRSRVKPSNARGHWRPILSTLEVSDADAPRDLGQALIVGPGGERTGTDLSNLFEQVTAELTQRSLIVLISDLFDDPAVLDQGLARLYHRRHDVVVLQVMDPAELNFEFRDASRFTGLEGEGKIDLDPAALRGAYLEALDEHRRHVVETCRKFRFDHLEVDTGVALGPVLSHLLAKRASAVRRK